jgi:ubiquinone/menaquinone biosynthesis C-methylase UbiE
MGNLAALRADKQQGEDMSAQIMDHNLKAAAMWGSGGRAFDEISRSVASAIEHCVTRLQPKPGEQIADIATGTGWTSRLVARSGAQVTGVDIAEGMLAGAREIAQEQGLAIDYRLGDAEALPFDDGTFDAVISTFGVMFAPDQSRAAAELARVCKRGGAAQFRTDLGVALLYDYLVTVGQRL